MNRLLNTWIVATVVLYYTAAVEENIVDMNYRMVCEQDHFSNNRAKRSFAQAASVGLKVVDRFLRQAVKDPSASENAQRFVYNKKGDMFQAVKDFYSVGAKPIAVPRVKGITKAGVIGDRIVIIRKREYGEATVTILRTSDVSDPKSVPTVIHYIKDGPRFSLQT